MAVTEVRPTSGDRSGPPPPAAIRRVRLPELDVIRVVASIEVVLWHLTFSGWAMEDPAHGIRFEGLSQVIRYGYFVPQLSR